MEHALDPPVDLYADAYPHSGMSFQDMKDSHDWKPTVGKYTIVNTEEQAPGARAR